MSHKLPRRRWWRRRKHRLDPMVDRSVVNRVIRYRARPYEEWTQRERDGGAVLVESALVLPLLTLLIAGGICLGLAAIQDLRVEFVTQEAARAAASGALAEDGVGELLEAAGFTMTVYEPAADRVTVTATGPAIAIPFFGVVTPEATATALMLP